MIRTIKIKELGEITELQPKVRLKDLKIPKGFRLLQFREFSLLCELYLELKVGEDYEWAKFKDSVVGLYSSRDGDLGVDGYYWDGNGGCVFGVRFIKVKK